MNARPLNRVVARRHWNEGEVVKHIKKHLDPSGANAPGVELLRVLADYPLRSVHAERTRIRNRTVLITRDGDGNVIGSVEQIEEIDFEHLQAGWFK
jgi:hypothetical protein